jgi:hypothetical protein
MNQLLRFSGSVKRDPAIETWMKTHTGDLGIIAQHWFEVMRKCGAWKGRCEPRDCFGHVGVGGLTEGVSNHHPRREGSTASPNRSKTLTKGFS